MKRKEAVDRKSLDSSVRDGSAYAAVDTVIGNYSIPYALALGASNAEIGLLSSIPKLFSIIVQPFAGTWADETKSIKRLNLISGLVGKLMIVPIALIPFLFVTDRVMALILLLSIFSLFISISNMSWMEWMANLVPISMRGKFFGRRNMLAGISGFATTLAVGWILGFYSNLQGFTIVFILAALGGLLSSYYVTKISDVEREVRKHKEHIIKWNLQGFLYSLRTQKNFSNFIVFATSFTLFVQIASPFFAVYALEVLDIGYGWYALGIAATAIAMTFSQPYWGKLSDRFGDKKIILVCGILAALVPLFWMLFVKTPLDVILVDLYAGFAWAGFDLALFNFLLDAAPPKHRPLYVSNYKILFDGAMFAGPLIGATIATLFASQSLFFLYGLQIVFLVSFVGRIITLYFASKLKEERVKGSEEIPVRYVFLKSLTTYPMREVATDIHYVNKCLVCWKREITKGLYRGS